MRRTLGWVLFGTGIVGLSYWGHEDHAKNIEDMIAAEATELAGTARHGVATEVSGRDITLRGIAHDEAEKTRLLDAAADLTGRRIVHDNLTVLPRQEIYSFHATSEGGAVENVVGFVPDQAARDAVAAAVGVDPETLELASGAPNAAWPDMVESGVGALSRLDRGTLAIVGNEAKLSGAVDTNSDLAALETALATAPEGYEWALDIAVARPDVAEYRFDAARSADGVTVAGYMPDQASLDGLSGALPDADLSGVALAANAPERWADNVNGGLEALSLLETGTLSMVGDRMVIDGAVRTEADRDALDAKLAMIPAGIAVENAIEVLEPAPEPVTVEATGTETTEIAESDTGETTVVASDAPVTEIAATPDVPAFELTMDPISGLVVSGAVPPGLDAQAIADLVGVAKVTGETQIVDGADGTALGEKIARLKGIVGEFETLNVRFDGDQMTVEGETLFDADPVRLTELLADVAGTEDVIRISKSETVYDDGYERMNALNGEVERFQSGFWIPAFDASSITQAECAERTEAAVDQTKIRFEEGSAEIDTVSRQILNRLSGIIGACMAREPETRILIGGHTDDVGSDDYNQELSEARAENVLAALVLRGLPEAQLTSRGYGETAPIADNSTDEGRALNRRTTFEWAE